MRACIFVSLDCRADKYVCDKSPRPMKIPAKNASGPLTGRGSRLASGPELQALSPRDARRPRQSRHLRVGRRLRSDPPRRRPLRRPRRQPARAERRVVHAGEPRGDQARAAGPVRSLSREPGRALRSGIAGDAARAGAAQRRQADLRRANTRRRQLRLLRARVPRARDGRGACRRPRPPRPRQRRLHADHRRAAARRRHLSTGRR